MDAIKKVVGPGAIIMSVLIAVGSRVSDIRDAKELGLPYWAWEAIAISIAALIIVAMLFGFQRRLDKAEAVRRYSDAPSGDEPHPNRDKRVMKPDSSVIVEGFEFHPIRRQFDWFRKRVEGTTEVWAFWCTGAAVYNNGLLRTGHITRLILAHFGNPELTEIAHVTDTHRDILVSHITEVVIEAGKRAIDCKQWLGHIPYNVTIGNPRANGMWVIIEPIVPFISADQRPQVILTDQTQPALCNRLRQSFLDMWADQSKHGA